MRRLLVAALLVAACGGAPAAAPAAFHDPVCEAYQLVAGTSGQWAAISAAIARRDLTGADAQFTIMEPNLKRAVNLISDAEAWAPGDAFSLNVQTAAADYIASMRQFRAGDYTEASKAAVAGNEQLGSATDAVPALKAAGLSC